MRWRDTDLLLRTGDSGRFPRLCRTAAVSVQSWDDRTSRLVCLTFTTCRAACSRVNLSLCSLCDPLSPPPSLSLSATVIINPRDF